MLDGILNRGFSSKCKSLMKATRTRIEVVRRRAEAKQRFLKEDLAKLLDNGLDINAYGRTEEFLQGQNLLSCYGFVEQSCEYIMKQLSPMQKLRDCPEDCREAVASLIFAAARFSDLPELRDLRDLFQERYGNCLECYVNQKFVEKLSSRAPAKEKKILLLQDIASEFSIKWDSAGFQKRMSLAETQQNKVPSHVPAGDYISANGKGSGSKADKQNIAPSERPERFNEGHRIQNSRERHVDWLAETPQNKVGPSQVPAGNYILANGKGSGSRADKQDIGPSERPERFNEGYRIQNTRDRHIDWLAETQQPTVGSSHVPSVNNVIANGKGNDSKADEPDVEHSERHRRFNERQRIQNSRERHILKKEKEDLHFSDKPLTTREASDSKGGKSYNLFVKEEESSRTRTKHSSRKTEKPASLSYGESLEGIASKGASHNHNFGINARSQDTSSYARSEAAHSSRGLPIKSEDVTFAWDTASQKSTVSTTKMVQEEEGNRLTSYGNFALPPPYFKPKDKVIPPPYVKPKDSKERASRGSKHSASEFDENFMGPSPSNRLDTARSSDRTNRESDLPNLEAQSSTPNRTNNQDHDKEFSYKDGLPLPKPKSVRRKHHKSASNHDVERKSEDPRVEKRSSSSRRRDHSRKGLQVLFDDDHHHKKDDEERVIDKLLLHYSKKPSKYDPEKLRKKPEAHLSHQTTPSTAEPSLHDRSSGDQHEMVSDKVPIPTRSVSLPPHEQNYPSEGKKVYTRAYSFQPDNHAKHVHPKLPDYDDLAARFASLRGR